MPHGKKLIPSCTARSFAAATLLLAGISLVTAEEGDVFEIFKPQLNLSYESSGEKEFKEDVDANISASESLRWRSLGLNLNVPLGGTHMHPGGRLLGHQFFAHAFSSGSRADISFLSESSTDLFSGGVGFTALLLSSGRKIYAASIFASVAEEEESLGDPDVRYSGLGIGSFATKKALWIYGGALTYNLGRPLAIPVFGGWGRLSTSWSIGGIVPFLLQAKYQRSEEWSLSLLLKIQGNQYGYRNEADDQGPKEFPGRDRDLRLRLVQTRLGAAFTWTFSGHLALVGEAGSIFGRRVVFAEGSDNFLDADAKPTGYARAMVRLSFGESLLDQELP